MKRKKRSGIREGNRFATFLMYFACVMIAFITLYPMYYVLILSLSSPQYASTMRVYTIPKGFDLSAYKVLVQNSTMWRAYLNTIVYVLPNTVLMIITSSVVAYGLNYKKLIGRKWLTMFLLIPMYFGGGMIPTFLLIVKLGLYDSPLSQIIPSCFSISEAAKIDGAGVLQVFTRVMIPLGKPIFAVVAVYTIVGVWNSWFGAMLYLPHTDWQPLQLYLRRLLIEATQSVKEVVDAATAREIAERQLSNAQLKYAMIIFTSLPVLCTYPFFQKYFIKGMVLGSLKE